MVIFLWLLFVFEEPCKASMLDPGRARASVPGFELLAPPDWTSNITEGNWSLSEHFSSFDNSSITFSIEHGSTIKYMLSSHEESDMQEAQITSEAFVRGISLTQIELSKRSELPENRKSSRKIGFNVSDAEYDSLRSLGYGVRYMVIHNPHFDFVPLSTIPSFLHSHDEPSVRLDIIRDITVSVIDKEQRLNEMGIIHGNLDLEAIHFRLTKDGYGTDVRFSDFANCTSTTRRGDWVREWERIARIFGQLVGLADISVSESYRTKIGYLVHEWSLSLHSLITERGAPPSEYASMSIDTINIAHNLLTEMLGAERPTRTPRK